MGNNQEENRKFDVALPVSAGSSDMAKREETVLQFWKENKIFEKSLQKDSPKGEFVFYDGPVTTNSKPVLHTMAPFAFKDVIPRYKTMRGYHVRRKGGWDTHGLPVELQIEKKLGFKSKTDIENYGIAAFNKLCKDSVWEYIELWKNFTKRMGYWADQEHPYVTYQNDYIESVWNVVKKINDQNLLYKDYKVVPWCPRCGTTLSSHELAQGYEDVKDLSVYVKFPIVGFLKAYFLAWTTTPWTLPGNVALAVGKDIDYVEIKIGEEIFVLAKERLSIISEPYEIIAEHKGKDMVGMEYEPLYLFITNLVSDGEKEKLNKAYKIYEADFVNTTDGTGIVHTAVMYGQDDFELGTKVGLPKHHLVNLEGKFVNGTEFLEGRFVKEVDINGKPTLAVDIIEDLKKRNLFFKQENYKHSYPHCWRCHTALIYYARDSWYIKMSDPKIKEKLISENKEINWEPIHIRDGRFGEWLREIKDWAISRERYWGTPLPVWQCVSCKKVEVLGSIADLKDKTKKSGNKYFVMRHGEAENNAKNIYSSNQKINHLTDKGKAEVLKTCQELKNKKITKIYCSPFLRTRETAEIFTEQNNFPKDQIIYDDRIRELEFGDFSDRPVAEYWDFMKDKTWEFDKKIPGGESFQDGKNRIGDFLHDIDQKYQDETILIISHGLSVELIPAIIENANQKRSLEIFHSQMKNKTASLHIEHEFIPLPHNENYELDLHRPYIDKITLRCHCGGDLIRTKEVMDVWFDSGAMPFAQDHYPFNSREILYPADFICEAIDQTRGWFYTLHAVGILMGRGLSYKNVICLGHLLDANGKKMSKSIGNVVDPWIMMEKYGVDTLRLWMYSVNQPGESKNFDEKTVALLASQVFGLLYNVLAFYELYRDKNLEKNIPAKSKNILDQWILARLDELVKLSTENLDNYKLLEPVRGVRDFIGDLSTWYLRRSRDRIKGGDKDARQTLYFVLKTLAKITAPFAPFTAEDIWLKLKYEDDAESVHLVEWPSVSKGILDVFSRVGDKVLTNMQTVRKIVTLGLEARQKAGVKVRQPLASLKSKIESRKLSSEYLDLIEEELNVKKIIFDNSISNEVELDTNITEELKQEGDFRELVRALQEMRKKMRLLPSDTISLSIKINEVGENLINKFKDSFLKIIGGRDIKFIENDGEEIKIDDLVFKVKIDKI
ncbi:isoleucine--tRNA ligase [Candidatus Nomurabacteria bacterium]|nr:isoleucine--tRNA ligase [Candidatus Nomurabacteria bacterium]